MIVLGWLTARWSGLQLAIRYTLLGIACLSGWLWPDRKIVPSNKKQTLTFYHLSLFLSLCLHLLRSFVLVPVSTSVFWYLGSVSLWRSTSTANGKTLHILKVCCFQGLDSSTFKQSEAIKTYIYIYELNYYLIQILTCAGSVLSGACPFVLLGLNVELSV